SHPVWVPRPTAWATTGGTYTYSGQTNVINDPVSSECTGAPHCVPNQFYCSQLPAGHLFTIWNGYSYGKWVLMNDGEILVSSYAGQSVWQKQ
ncbi:MAG TPA: hypothetical protein VFT06_04845, partial [Flavisolibacter sp.]|nr:hypothetical protein [Flavisolibacter sp.]